MKQHTLPPICQVGTRLVCQNDDGEFFGEVVHMDDPRFSGKIAFDEDVCVLWETGQKITYDPEFVVEHFKLR